MNNRENLVKFLDLVYKMKVDNNYILSLEDLDYMKRVKKKKYFDSSIFHDEIVKYIVNNIDSDLSNYQVLSYFMYMYKDKFSAPSNLKSKVRNQYKEYVIENINDNKKIVNLKSFIKYYNSIYHDDFRSFGYDKKTKLNERIFFEIMYYKDKDFSLNFLSTGFEDELLGNEKTSFVIKNENKKIADFMKKDKELVDKYNMLLKKYDKETKELFKLKDTSLKYFIYNNILEEDRDDYYDMVNKYFMLDAKFKKNYLRGGLASRDADEVKESLYKNLENNPSDMKKIVDDFIAIYFNNKYLIGVSRFINTGVIFDEVKNNHINNKALYYFKELSIIYSNNLNMYRVILDNKNFNVLFHDDYIKMVSLMLPDALDIIKIIDNKFKKDKELYFNKKKDDFIDNSREHIFKLAYEFVNDKECTTFRMFLIMNSKFRKKDIDKVYDCLKKDNPSLYRLVKKKEFKEYSIIMSYLENDYSSFEYYLRSNNITRKRFDKVLLEVKDFDLDIYNDFMKKYVNENNNNYANVANDMQCICNKIINGVEGKNGEHRDYNYLDYKLETKLNLEEFDLIIRNNLHLCKNDLIKVIKFIKANSINYMTNKVSEIMFNRDNIKYDTYSFSGRSLTFEEQQAIFKFMDYNGFSNDLNLYCQIIRSYFNNEIDLGPFINTNSKKLVKVST